MSPDQGNDSAVSQSGGHSPIFNSDEDEDNDEDGEDEDDDYYLRNKTDGPSKTFGNNAGLNHGDGDDSIV